MDNFATTAGVHRLSTGWCTRKRCFVHIFCTAVTCGNAFPVVLLRRKASCGNTLLSFIHKGWGVIHGRWMSGDVPRPREPEQGGPATAHSLVITSLWITLWRLWIPLPDSPLPAPGSPLPAVSADARGT